MTAGWQFIFISCFSRPSPPGLLDPFGEDVAPVADPPVRRCHLGAGRSRRWRHVSSVCYFLLLDEESFR